MKTVQSIMQKKWAQILFLSIMGTLFYLVLGQEWVEMQDDTQAYLYPDGASGVMPVYPMFLFCIKVLFGEARQLDAAVVVQSALAITCTMIFAFYLQKQFRLKFAEAALIYIACMLPFSICLPEVGVTHQILTEGIAYAMFYLYFLFLLQYIFTGRAKYLLLTVFMSVFLALTRSQLVFLLIATAVAFVIVELVKCKGLKQTMLRKIGRIGLSAAAAAGGTLVMVLLVYRILGWYLAYPLPVMRDWKPETAITETEEKGEQEETRETEEKKGQEAKKESAAQTVPKTSTAENMSQMNSLLVIRGFYEADEADVALFNTAEMQEIFRRVFRAVDEKQYRYVYARQDLYMWRDLVCDRIVQTSYAEIHAYLQENPEVNLNPREVITELGWKVLWKHFDRYLYHTIRIMIPAFIASVFWQVERIYLLCHIITLLLYIAAIGGSLFCIRNGGNKKAAAFTITVVGFIFIMVSVICAVFVGTQRYMAYAMGIFYCSMYLLAREILFILAGKFPDAAILTGLAGWFDNKGGESYGKEMQGFGDHSRI